MKKNILIVCLLFSVTVFSQSEKYQINGRIGNLNSPAKVYLSYESNPWVVVDSAVLKNGMFELNGEVVGYRKAIFLLDRNQIGIKNMRYLPENEKCSFYLEKGKLIVASSDSITKATVSGTPLNSEYQEYKNLVNNVVAQEKAIFSEFRAASKETQKSPEFKSKMDEKFKANAVEMKKLRLQYIESHSNSFVSLDLLKIIEGTPIMDVSYIEPLFNGLSEPIRNSKLGNEYLQEIQNNKQIAVGAPARNFTQPTADGKSIKLSDFNGKYVLLDFWASWCGPCRRENPNVVKAYNQFKSENFTIIGISLDAEKQKEAWLKAITDDHLPWIQVSDLKGWANEAARLYLIQAIPQNVLISPKGIIIAKNLRGEALEAKLREIFK